MPKRQGGQQRGSHNRSSAAVRGRGSGHGGHGRGRGRGGGGGGGGGGGSRGGRGGGGRGNSRSNSNHQEDGFISLSQRKRPQSHHSFNPYTRQKPPLKNEYRHRGVKFNKASRGSSAVEHHHLDDSDEGLDSDEIDDDDDDEDNDDDDGEGEDEFLEQPFDWIEADQDPEREQKLAAAVAAKAAAEAAALAASLEAQLLVPMTGWGGALAYNAPLPPPSPLTNDRGSTESDEDNDDEDISVAISPRPAATSQPSFEMGFVIDLDGSRDDTAPSSPFDYMDLSGDSIPRHTPTIETSRISRTAAVKVLASEDQRAPAVVEAISDIKEEVTVIERTQQQQQQQQQQHQKYQKRQQEKQNDAAVSLEPEPMQWFIDTEPAVVPHYEVQETYIELSEEPEFLGGHRRKKTKRSKRGGRQIREKEAQRRKALVDDGSLLLEEDESDGKDDEQLALEDYLQNTTDFDNENQLDTTSFSLLQNLVSGAGHSNDIGGFDPDDSDFGQDSSDDDGSDHDFVVEDIAKLTKLFEDFFKNRDRKRMRLPAASPEFYESISLLAEKHNMSIGRKRGRTVVVRKASRNNGTWTYSQSHGRETAHPRRGAVRSIKREQQQRRRLKNEGAVVGEEASEISVENVGHRMLAKMGWSPGTGLGASREGITQPVSAVVKTSKLGLGFQ